MTISPRSLGKFVIGVLVASFGASLGAQEGAVEQNRVCFGCHGDENEMEFEDGTEVSIQVENRMFLSSAHGRFACVVCHVDFDEEEHAMEEQGDRLEYRQRQALRCVACHGPQDARAEEIDEALLPKAPLAGHLHSTDTEGAPLCTDCHDSHAIPRGAGSVSFTSAGCAKCHSEVYSIFAASAHGVGLQEQGGIDLPGCTSCHAGHGSEGREQASREVRLARPCIGCHGDASRMEKYGLSSRVVTTYLNDFHGVSVRFYGESEDEIALPTLVCSDCHGIHDVARVESMPPEQMKAQVLGVCRQCHEDASESFPDAWMSHYEPSLDKAPLVFLVRLSYWIFIPFVMLGLTLHIIIHVVIHQRRRRAQGLGRKQKPHPDDVGKSVVRFALRQRLEHLFVMLAFVLLVVTGLPQKFSDSSWAVVVTNWMGGVDTMRALHRLIGIVFTGLCVMHLVTAIGLVLSGRARMSIVPTAKDFQDARQNLRYYAGVTDVQPKFDRFDYRQKFEYWGMIVGSLVMIVSGFVLYFPMLTAEFLPGQFIPAAKVAHSYEAMMALLTIVVWHMYGAHLNPDCFPMDRSIFTGRIPLSHMKHEHLLEWEREKDRLEVITDSGEKPRDDDSAASTS